MASRRMRWPKNMATTMTSKHYDLTNYYGIKNLIIYMCVCTFEYTNVFT
jgi:hypothetical protein